MRVLYVLLTSLLALTSSLWAEGTKQLRPNEADFGSIHIRPNDPNYTRFGEYGAPSENQIKIRISDTTEVIYFGLNNQIESNPNNGQFADNVPFRILDPQGNIVYESIIPGLGEEGNVPNWDQAVAGPAEIVGAGGYDAIALAVSDTGDYVIEFNPPRYGNGNQMYINIHLFDITVADENNNAIDGRLHSQGWQINAHSFNNPFRATLFPYHPDGIAYAVDFNDIRPYLFVINFNSTGTDSTGNFFNDRLSQHYDMTYPEFEVFLSPPDENVYPRFKREVSFNASITNTTCDSTVICLSFETNAPGEVEGYIDFNGNGQYDENLGEIYFGDITEGNNNETCITWDGRDSRGRIIDQRQMQMISSFGYGVMHLPIYDAENHENGFLVTVHSPAGLNDPELFWDDSDISNKGQSLDGLTNINGCSSGTGCHRWTNRGEDNNYSETINTWWYSQVQYDTLVFQNIWNRPVRLSFDPDNLDQDERTICEGDSMTFYVYENYAHFDTTVYDYEWYVNGTLVPEFNVNEIRRQVFGTTSVTVVAIDKDARECTWTDELIVSTVPPVEISATIFDVPCSNDDNAISININTGPPSPVASWAELPSVNSLTINDLDTGTYTLHIEDPAFSANCALDTFFIIVGTEAIAIESLSLEDTYCFNASGFAEVTMVNPTKDYVFTWDNISSANDTVGGLAAGNHTLVVSEPATGCEVDTIFNILGAVLDITLESTDELCGDASGSINVLLPDGKSKSNFDITINGVQQNLWTYEGLSAGSYTINVSSTTGDGCEDQETAVILNENRTIPLVNILSTSSDCGSGSGTAAFIMANNGVSYLFKWEENSFSTTNQFQNLTVGTYNMTIKEEGTLCELDTTVFIPGQNFTYEGLTQDEFCSNGNGSITILVDDPNVEISWSDGVTTFDRTGLSAGRYNFTLTHPLDPSCQRSNFYYLDDGQSDVEADFTYRSLVGGDELGVGDVIKFNEEATGDIESYSWNFDDGTTSLKPNPEHIFDNDQVYNVRLRVTDIYGCQAQVSKPVILIRRSPCGAVLPNAFSPNGDNMNDNIGLLGVAYNVDLRIYNRWGELVFRGYQDEDRWDGYYRGESSPIGAYPYVLEYTCPDNRGNMIKEKKVGDISLVR